MNKDTQILEMIDQSSSSQKTPEASRKEGASKSLVDQVNHVGADLLNQQLQYQHHHMQITGPLSARAHDFKELAKEMPCHAHHLFHYVMQSGGTPKTTLKSIQDETDIPTVADGDTAADSILDQIIGAMDDMIEELNQILTDGAKANDHLVAHVAGPVLFRLSHLRMETVKMKGGE